ncbi:MAG: T9SS type A sorting domain-containing protein, partial [FCB group bacterium]|nr:T9SS type A sorting domain-containing protein [FCB group bacterium]
IGIYLEKGLDYLLIGGNSTVVPHRGLSCSVDSDGTIYSSNDIPSDLYYAALDGDWDANGNGFFGEYNDTTGFDEADLLPELAVGRMPGANGTEIAYMIAKSMRYQAEPVIADMDRHVFFGESLWHDPETWGADYLDLLIGERDDNGYTTQGIPDNIDIYKQYERDSETPWNRETVKNELAAGRAFVHHSGHANTTYLMKFSTWDIQDSDFITVNGTDHAHPVFYSHGCNGGAFDNVNSIASRLVNTPVLAAGGVFNSRYGWFNEGTTEGPAIHLHREFMNALYGMRIHPFGWTHTMSRIATAPWVTAEDQHEQNALRWNFYTINVLGDPAMRLYSGTPETIDIEYDISGLASGSLSATISREGIPVSSARITVLDAENNLLGIAESNNSGFAEVMLQEMPMSGDSIYVHVRGNNILPADTVFHLQQTGISIPEDYDLLSVYPNPFNPETSIRFVLPEAGETEISIYDIRGKKVHVLVHAFRQAGEHHIRFNASHLSAGIYICRLQSGATRMNRKIVLLK